MGRNYTLNLLGESERHKFGGCQMNSTSERDSKINPQNFTISYVNQKVVQMTITNANKVATNGKASHRLYKFVFEGDKTCSVQTETFETIPQQIPPHQPSMFLEIVRDNFTINQLQIDCLLEVRVGIFVLRQLRHPFHDCFQSSTFV